MFWRRIITVWSTCVLTALEKRPRMTQLNSRIMLFSQKNLRRNSTHVPFLGDGGDRRPRGPVRHEGHALEEAVRVLVAEDHQLGDLLDRVDQLGLGDRLGRLPRLDQTIVQLSAAEEGSSVEACTGHAVGRSVSAQAGRIDVDPPRAAPHRAREFAGTTGSRRTGDAGGNTSPSSRCPGIGSRARPSRRRELDED